MYRQFIRRNISSVSIIFFVIIFSIIQMIKPTFLYDSDGSLRKFGIGRRRKTVLPIWFMTIILAFLSYCGVLYYLALPKLH